jgi:hypothetical protein
MKPSTVASVVPLKGLLTLALTVGASLVAGSAQAFTFFSVGSWTNPVGGGVSTVSTSSVGSENQIRWGIPIDTQPSGLGYTGNAGNANFGDTILLGSLRHFNNAIAGGSGISSVDLNLNLSFGLPIPSQNFSFQLAINETPNSGAAADCPFFSTTPCSDQISWTNTTSTNTFSVDGVDYTLQLLGFSTSPGSAPLNQFISQEGGTAQTALYGRVVRSEAVPEPTTLAGLGLAAGGLAALRRRKAKG